MKKGVSLFLVLLLLVTIVPANQVCAKTQGKEAKVCDYDYDDYDLDDDFDLDDYLDSDDDNYVLYERVVNQYANQTLSKNSSLTGQAKELDPGDTVVYKFTLNKDSMVTLKFNDTTYGSLSFAIFNEYDTAVYEKTGKFVFEAKKYTTELDAGTYTLKFCATDYLTDISFKLFLAESSVSKTLKGTQTYKAAPGFGTGKWSTSNKNVVKLSTTSGSTCTFKPVKPGNATITFKGANGTATYFVTVKKVTKTIKKTIRACESFSANPNQGKGTWKVGNKKVASITSKSASKTTITGKKKGSTTVTFSNALVTYKYKVTVKMGKNYPILDAYLTKDFADGLEPMVLIANNSDKTIKYVRLTMYYYNRVNDPVYWFDECSEKLQFVGPVKPWSSAWYKGSASFYSESATKMRVKKATIIYTDGKTKTVNINKTYGLK